LTRGETRSVIAGPAGALEVALNVPVDAPATAPHGIALVAHPNPQQGGTMDNKVAQTLARTFAALGYASVRFNFRGIGASEGAFDNGVGETEDALAALAFARTPADIHEGDGQDQECHQDSQHDPGADRPGFGGLHGRSLRMQFSKKACGNLYHRRAASDVGWRCGALMIA
jgi:hypothetical protein